MPTYVKLLRQRESTDEPVSSRRVLRYQVRGATTEAEAYNSIDAETGLRVPQRLEALTDDQEYVCMVRRADWDNFSQEYGNIWTVRCEFHKPQFELLTPDIEWEFGHALHSMPASSDYYGRAMLNSAGDPLIGTYPKTMVSLVLTVRFNAYYRSDIAKDVIDKVNTNSMTIFPGGWNYEIEPAQMRCMSYRPLNMMTRQGQPQRLEASFAFLDGNYPWFLHAANQGYRGWYLRVSDNFIGDFHTIGDRKRVEFPIQLTNTGTPVNYDLYGVTEALYPWNFPPGVPEHVRYEFAEGGTYDAIFETLGNYDFAGFLPGIM